MFKNEDIIVKKSLLGKVGKKLNLWEKQKQNYTILLFIIFISLITFTIVTVLESRFLLSSVVSEIDGVGLVKGMSFLGDTMVWPYIFLIPLSLLLTYKSATLTVLALNGLLNKIENIFVDSKLPNDYHKTIEYTKQIF